jgi:hypothetical protein
LDGEEEQVTVKERRERVLDLDDIDTMILAGHRDCAKLQERGEQNESDPEEQQSPARGDPPL